MIVDRNKPHPQEGKKTLQIVAGFPIVAAKSGQVLDHDAIHFPGPYIIHQPFKLRAVKVCPRPSVVAVEVIELHIRLAVDVALNQFPLGGYRVRSGLSAVLH